MQALDCRVQMFKQKSSLCKVELNHMNTLIIGREDFLKLIIRCTPKNVIIKKHLKTLLYFFVVGKVNFLFAQNSLVDKEERIFCAE